MALARLVLITQSQLTASGGFDGEYGTGYITTPRLSLRGVAM